MNVLADDGYPTVKAVVKPAKATVGQPVEYRINIAARGKQDVRILLPKEREFFPDKGKDDGRAKEGDDEEAARREVPLYIINSAKKTDRSDAAMTDLSVVITLSYYRTGSHKLPEIEIIGSDGKQIGYRVPEVLVEEINKEGAFQDIEPPLDLGGNYYRLILVIAGAVLLGIIITLLVLYLRKKLRQRREAEPHVPPLDIFRRELAALCPRELIEADRIEDYVVGISLIFRRYLSLLLGIDAVEMTTPEIEAALYRRLPREVFGRFSDEVTRSFDLWDLSKFAEFTPSDEVLLKNLEAISGLAEKLSGEMSDGIPGV